MDEVRNIVVEELKQLEEYRDIVTNSEETLKISLIGKGSKIQSIGLVTLIFGIEERIQNDLGVSVQIASERAVSLSQSPFRTIGSLVSFASELVKEVR